MKALSCLGLLLLSNASVQAHPIKWTATGTVSQATAGVFGGVAVNDAVEVAFSYDSDLTINGLSQLPFEGGVLYKTDFAGAVDFKIAVKIGAQTWEGALPTAPDDDGVYPLLSESWEIANAPDKLTLTASASQGANFPSFPYTGTFPSRRIEMILRDDTSPCDFLIEDQLPGKDTLVSEITSGAGSITAGTNAIRFNLNLASITVIEEEPAIPLSMQKTITGFELKWHGKPGVVYQLLESGDLQEWEPVSEHEGLDEEISVLVEPFELHPERRFYKVIEL